MPIDWAGFGTSRSPAPLSAPFAAYTVTVATEAASKAESLEIVTG